MTTTTTFAGPTVRTARPTRLAVDRWWHRRRRRPRRPPSPSRPRPTRPAFPLAVGGEPIPLVGFAQLTLVASLVGTVLAVCLTAGARPARGAPSCATTVALTVAVDRARRARRRRRLRRGSRSHSTHVVAAAIVIPALASRLSD